MKNLLALLPLLFFAATASAQQGGGTGCPPDHFTFRCEDGSKPDPVCLQKACDDLNDEYDRLDELLIDHYAACEISFEDCIGANGSYAMCEAARLACRAAAEENDSDLRIAALGQYTLDRLECCEQGSQFVTTSFAILAAL